jgi:hypothetical protein
MNDSILEPGDEPPLASHLVSPRTLYTHHGIYVGGGRVIHYAGLAYGLRRGPIEEVSLERFAQGRVVGVRCDHRAFDRHEVVDRARSRLGESRYRLLTNNCAHLCAWALRDDRRGVWRELARLIQRAVLTHYESVTRHLRAIQ